MSDIKNIIEESFVQYSGAVLQSRALVDVRDCLKPSARQIFFSMLERKLIHKNPYKKTANAVGMAMADYYIHGDSSCEGVIMRAGQDFAMRYPLIEVKGNVGSLMESGNWAAMRYTESRLSALSDILFEDIKKGTITDWRDNYDNTKQYPGVLPSKGFYNIVNGTTGIGIGMASSIPQFNLVEINDALIKLLWNPEISFDEIYCQPDFATGAILLNEKEIKESLKNGQGASCKLRSVIEYNSNERCFVVTEIPYGTYTNTICKQIEEIVNGKDNPGIDRFIDLTGSTPLIKIYLSKKANINKVLKYLYKNTSLQSYFGINLTMLEMGRFPKVFTWKEALQSHIDHEIEVYTNGFKFDLDKILHRIHIIDGLLKAINVIDEVISIIKTSSSTTDASNKLREFLQIDEDQAKAILDIKLARLARLEIVKLEKEREDLVCDAEKIQAILDDENLLKKEVEKGLREVAKKYGDARRTQILNIESEEDEPVEIKSIQVSLTNNNNIIVNEISSLYTQKRGGVGNKIKLNKGEYVISTTSGVNTDILLFFTSNGMSYRHPISETEKVCALTSTSKQNQDNNIIFFTKKGIIKKSKRSEYISNRNNGLRAITLDPGDEIVTVLVMNEEPIGILSKEGQFVITNTKSITPIGRVAKGRKGMKLNEGDEVVSVRVLDNAAEVMSITEKGYTKRTKISEFTPTSLNTKGVKLQKIKEKDDKMVDFLFLKDEKNVIAVASKAQIKVSLQDIPSASRGTMGNKLMKISEKEKIIGISSI